MDLLLPEGKPEAQRAPDVPKVTKQGMLSPSSCSPKAPQGQGWVLSMLSPPAHAREVFAELHPSRRPGEPASEALLTFLVHSYSGWVGQVLWMPWIEENKPQWLVTTRHLGGLWGELEKRKELSDANILPGGDDSSDGQKIKGFHWSCLRLFCLSWFFWKSHLGRVSNKPTASTHRWHHGETCTVLLCVS